MENVNLTLSCIKGKVMVKTDAPTNILEQMQLTFTAQLAMLNAALDAAPKDMVEAMREDLYDRYNASASSVLSKFAPNIEQHPDLTVEAILEAENNIIDRRYKEMACKKKGKGKGGK